MTVPEPIRDELFDDDDAGVLADVPDADIAAEYAAAMGCSVDVAHERVAADPAGTRATVLARWSG
jgi:hypothetical protein